jgi:hypothetical protein
VDGADRLLGSFRDTLPRPRDWTPQRHLDIRALELVERTSPHVLDTLDHLHSSAANMANEDGGRKPSWSSWLAPGDSRRAEEHRLQKPDNGIEQPSTFEHAPNTSRSQTQNTSEPGFNPLIAFKHFVDDTFSAISEFSDNMAELRQAAQNRQTLYQKMNDAAYERWAGSPGSRAHEIGERDGKVYYETKLPYEDAAAITRCLVRASEAANLQVDPQKIVALYNDPEFNPCHVIEKTSPWPFYSRNPDTANGRHDAGRLVPSSTHWLSIDWFKHSPYSPVNLEADSMLGQYDTKWRHAFEDLLEAALDKPMTSREKFGVRGPLSGLISTWRGPGLDWMLSLQCRGILPPQLPHMYKNEHVNAAYFSNSQFWSMLDSRWSGEYVPTRNHDLTHYRILSDEYDQLVEEIDTPAPQDGTDLNGELTAEQHDIHKGFLDHLEEKRKRNRRAQWGPIYGDTTTGRCPDEMDREVGEAMRQSLEPDTELDVYEQLENSYSETPQRHLTRCPDDLGRAVGDAVRQNGARPFTADNGSSDERFENFDFEKFLATDDEPVPGVPEGDEKLRQDNKMQISLLRQQEYGKEQLKIARMQEWLRLARQGQENVSPIDFRCALADLYNIIHADELDDEHDPPFGSAEDVKRQFEQMFNQHMGLENATDEEPVSVGSRHDDGKLQSHNLQIALMQQQQQQQQQKLEQLHKALALESLRQMQENISPYDDRAVLEHYKSILAFEPGPTPGSAADIERQLDGVVDQQMSLENAVDKLDDKAEVLMFFVKELDEQLRELRKGQKELKEAQAEARTPHDQKQNARQIAIAPTTGQSDSPRPQVLSTLTTTQTTRLPDGSVKTTVVLKRRFADGAEDTQESTQTSFDESAASTAGSQDPSKKGWFWS